jgi:hypothetical protein
VDGAEGDNMFTRDTAPVRTTEALTAGGNSNSSSSGPSTPGNTPAATKPSGATTPKVDLWDRSWPGGRYYWTVVPVRVEIQGAKETSLTEPSGQTTITVASVEGISTGTDIQFGGALGESATVASVQGDQVTLNAPLLFSHSAGSPVTVGGKIIYQETELPQDACTDARVLDFGKDSAQAAPVDSGSVPYATGLSPNGRLLTSRRAPTVFYGPPLVAWKAAPAATKYEIQWGPATNPTRPWRPVGAMETPATSVMLHLSPGTWRYRVRGINESLPGNQKMTWSGLTSVRIAKPTLRVTGG